MKHYILALAIVLALSTSACAAYDYSKPPTQKEISDMESYKGGSYCTRTIDDPEVFRIGLPRSAYKPHASDCEVRFAGHPKAVLGCRIQRCDIFMSSAGR